MKQFEKTRVGVSLLPAGWHGIAASLDSSAHALGQRTAEMGSDDPITACVCSSDIEYYKTAER
ncbi:MAG: hypothetical protein AAFY08_11795 [Planctomycetota bacterium]